MDKNKSVADELEEVESMIAYYYASYGYTTGYLNEKAAELRGKYQLMGWQID